MHAERRMVSVLFESSSSLWKTQQHDDGEDMDLRSDVSLLRLLSTFAGVRASLKVLPRKLALPSGAASRRGRAHTQRGALKWQNWSKSCFKSPSCNVPIGRDHV